MIMMDALASNIKLLLLRARQQMVEQSRETKDSDERSERLSGKKVKEETLALPRIVEQHTNALLQFCPRNQPNPLDALMQRSAAWASSRWARQSRRARASEQDCVFHPLLLLPHLILNLNLTASITTISMTLPPNLDLPTLLTSYNRNGYIIIDDLFTPLIPTLRAQAASIVSQTRSGNWPHVRRVGKQFPPFDAVTTPDYWGVQHLMHPQLPHHDTWRAFYSQSAFLEIAAALLECGRDRLQMELFNLLINPESHAFALGWHRDDVRPDVSREEELERLEKAPVDGVQWNAALYDDDCLFVVPGTHTRIRTDEERKANLEQPLAPVKVDNDDAGEGNDVKGIDGNWAIDPPSVLRVHLKAGQTIFYSQRILHRASYLPWRQRATLHGCYGKAGAAGEGAEGGERARMILQHGVEWMKDPELERELPEDLRPSELG